MIIKFLDNVLKDLKKLKKRYSDVEKDIDLVVQDIQNGILGDKLQNTAGFDIYKIRAKNTSASTGKSGGFRVIHYVKKADIVYIITIYSKSDRENITAKEIVDVLLKEI